MAVIKRVFVFFLVNILILTTIAITWSLLASYFGIDMSSYVGLMFLCLIFGMGGAFISLLLSKKVVKWSMGVKILDPQATHDPRMREVIEQVHRMSVAAGLSEMPEVGIYESNEVNAFATGPSKRNSLVAVSTGLLNRLEGDEVEAVIGHEVAHIANGDMVTMTLIQGIINTLVMFVAQIVARIVASQVDEKFSWIVHIASVIILQIALSILGSLLVNYYSRQREFRADAGGAKLAGRGKMLAALRALGNSQHLINPSQEGFASLKISGVQKNRLARLLSTHPPMEERIRRLETGRF